jgi:retron-type reverse transcriptase
MSEIPVHCRPRRLADWINPTGAKKVHSLIDKVYQRKNLEMAWEMVKANRGSGGVDGQSLEEFAAQSDQQLERLQNELKDDVYRPQPVRQVQIPKAGKPGEFRMLGIPTIYDRVCQQALLNRLEPIFEPVFDEANFGYRRGRSTKDALRKVWKETTGGREWIVDADLKDFFGSVDHGKLLTLVAQRVADGRVLRLIEAMLKAGSYGRGRLFPSERGTPQGGVVSPLLSNILLTPFDQEMRRKGYQMTRYADDWLATCESAGEARAAIAAASDSEGVRRAVASAEGAGGACPAGIRVSWVQDQARQATSVATEQDPLWYPVGGVVRLPSREIDPTFHGSGTRTNRTTRAAQDHGAD